MSSPTATSSTTLSASPRAPSSSPASGTQSSPELAKFINDNPPQKARRTSRSPLSSFRSEIEELKARGYSLAEIQAFLRDVGQETSRTAIHNFLRKTRKTSDQAASK